LQKLFYLSIYQLNKLSIKKGIRDKALMASVARFCPENPKKEHAFHVMD